MAKFMLLKIINKAMDRYVFRFGVLTLYFLYFNSAIAGSLNLSATQGSRLFDALLVVEQSYKECSHLLEGHYISNDNIFKCKKKNELIEICKIDRSTIENVQTAIMEVSDLRIFVFDLIKFKEKYMKLCNVDGPIIYKKNNNEGILKECQIGDSYILLGLVKKNKIVNKNMIFNGVDDTNKVENDCLNNIDQARSYTIQTRDTENIPDIYLFLSNIFSTGYYRVGRLKILNESNRNQDKVRENTDVR